ncbi:MAG: DUF308 domain-containing protein [Lachnospiraceae bacterium]|nr:DUF308 domain-containing protein [Lachnospiraceae bacterium]
MGKMKRFELILKAVFMILAGIIIVADPENGYQIVTAILCLSLLIYGIRMLIYYLTMARHMVGGRLILFVAVIELDFALFTMTLSDVPKLYVVLYLLAINALSGVIEILRSLESRRGGASTWKLNMTHGIINIAIAVMSLVFIKNTNMLSYMYCLGLFYSAAINVIRALRRTAIVYVA